MAEVAGTRRAVADLDDIWLHVAPDNAAAADRLIDRLVARCRQLERHPGLGVARPEIAPEARALTLGDYLILYRVRDGGVEIVRVVRGARRLKGIFEA